MNYFKVIILGLSLLVYNSCTDLSLNPPAQASSEEWYDTQKEFEMALNDLFRGVFWPLDDIAWTDDYVRRTVLNPITDGTIDGEWGKLSQIWKLKYKSISRANRVLSNLEKDEIDLAQRIKKRLIGNARFVRAAHYSYLINHWGKVPYYNKTISLEKAYKLPRTPKSTILDSIYKDYNIAINRLPKNYKGRKYATKGAALAMKARVALYNEDWKKAKDASESVIKLGIYGLYDDYGELFKLKTQNNKEVIFSMPNSAEFDKYSSWPPVTGAKGTITRTAGGYANNWPSWMLFSAYLCTDGLPIDESPLYNPRKPFENRDPRLSETTVPFGEPWLGYIYAPHPDSTKVLKLESGSHVNNRDTRSVNQYASFNGLVWKKGIDEDWLDDRIENDRIIMRYADVLLMYAEAKIELNDIDKSVLDAINKVRARAYGVKFTETQEYPAVKTTKQQELRKLLRIERRMELAFEGRRYMDIIRWKLADKVLNKAAYGMLNVEPLQEKVISEGLWFFPDTPKIDEDGVANFKPMYSSGLIRKLVERNFDRNKQYLWPIPTKDIKINDNLEQNPGY